MEPLDSKTWILRVTDLNLKRNIRERVRQTPGSKSLWTKMGSYIQIGSEQPKESTMQPRERTKRCCDGLYLRGITRVSCRGKRKQDSNHSGQHDLFTSISLSCVSVYYCFDLSWEYVHVYCKSTSCKSKCKSFSSSSFPL